jgi:hypothetical protein
MVSVSHFIYKKIVKILAMIENIVLLMYQLAQQFYNKQIGTTVLVFVYCVEVLLHVSTLSGHH